MRVYIEGIGLRGPGLDGWSRGAATLVGRDAYEPSATVLPPSGLLPANERRRAVGTVRLALEVGSEALAHAQRDAAETATVFTSSGGDGQTIHDILEVLSANGEELSPTRFHNSVHNAPAGYWSIATNSRAPTSSVCCHDVSFAAGLLEAAAQATVEDRPVTLVAYDVPYPEPLKAVRPIGAMFGVALILTPGPTMRSLARCDIEVRHASSAATPMAHPALERLRRGTPAAHSLPILSALARAAKESVVLEYLSGNHLEVEIDAGGDRSAAVAEQP